MALKLNLLNGASAYQYRRNCYLKLPNPTLLKELSDAIKIKNKE